MKNWKIFLLLAFTIIASTLFAQSTRVGIVVNPAISNWRSTNNDIQRYKSGTGISYDLTVDIALFSSNYFFVGTGLGYTSYSTEIKLFTDNPILFNNKSIRPPRRIEFKLNYIETPLLLGFKTKEYNNFTYFVKTGLIGGLNIKAIASSDDGILKNENVNDSFRLFNLKFALEGGIEYPLYKSISAVGSIKYTKGISDITTFNGVQDKAGINSLGFVLGLKF